MLLNTLNIIYVLIAIAMVAFILLQRGAGATAGASFGAGASGTVFGARGAGSFLTRTTAVLAISFFVLSLGMGMYVSRGAAVSEQVDLGVMGATTSDVPSASGEKAAPAAAPGSDVPAAPATVAPETVPAAPVATAPATPAATSNDTAPAQGTQTDDEPAR